jgi:hypothetical protein
MESEGLTALSALEIEFLIAPFVAPSQGFHQTLC